MSVLLLILGAFVNAVIIGYLARRLIGVPVGWPRTILLSIGVNFAISPILNWITGLLQMAPVTDHAVVGVAETLVVTLTILWILVFEIAALAVLEAVVPTGSLPNPLLFLVQLPAHVKRAARYLQILQIMAKHGLAGHLGGGRASGDLSDSSLARSIREAFTEGGVTFVKLGQMLSTRPDLLPPAYIREFSKLQSDVPPEPWDQVRAVLESDLGRPVAEVFPEIDPVPIAAASVAQIHVGRLPDGQEVVVKIQRARARAQVTADIDIVVRLARQLDRRTRWARRLGVVALAEGFVASVVEELDYGIELSNMQAIAASTTDIGVPRAYPELSSARVLVMEKMPGRPLSAAGDLLAAMPVEQRDEMARLLFAAILRQVIADGIFHADLHAGNIFVDGDGHLALLDFGSVGRIDLASRHALSTLLLAIDRQDSIIATDALLDLLGIPPELDARLLEADVGQLIMRYGGGVRAGGSAQMFVDLFAIVLRHRLSVPPPIAAAFRALGALEGSLLTLTSHVDVVTVARAEGRRLMAEQLSLEGVRDVLETQLAGFLPVLQRLPRRVDRITHQLETGKFSLSVSAFSQESDRAFVTGLTQQLVVAVLASALGLGGILLLAAGTGPMLAPGLGLYAFLGLVFLLFAFVLGARALVLVFRQAPGRFEEQGDS